MKTLIDRWMAAAGALGLMTTLAVAQNANVLEIGRVNPEGGAKSRALPMVIAGQTKNVNVEEPAPITQGEVSRAEVAKQKTKVTGADNKPETKELSGVRIKLNGAGKKSLATLTKDWQGKMLAIVVDGKVVATPVIDKPITAGELSVGGNMTPEEAKALASKIQASAGKK